MIVLYSFFVHPILNKAMSHRMKVITFPLKLFFFPPIWLFQKVRVHIPCSEVQGLRNLFLCSNCILGRAFLWKQIDCFGLEKARLLGWEEIAMKNNNLMYNKWINILSVNTYIIKLSLSNKRGFLIWIEASNSTAGMNKTKELWDSISQVSFLQEHESQNFY